MGFRPNPIQGMIQSMDSSAWTVDRSLAHPNFFRVALPVHPLLFQPLGPRCSSAVARCETGA